MEAGGRRSDSGCVRWAGRWRGLLACLLPQPATKGRAAWLPCLVPLGEVQVGRGSVQWWGAGMCSSGQAVSLPAVGAEGGGWGEGSVKSGSE